MNTNSSSNKHPLPVCVMSLRSVEAMVDHLDISDGQAAIHDDRSLWSIAVCCNSLLARNFGLVDNEGILASPQALHMIVQHIFAADIRGFFTETSTAVLVGLDGPTKARMLVQAMAGMVLIYRRLAESGPEITTRIFNRELQLFAESDIRTTVMGAIETSPIFGKCLMKNQIVDLVMDAIEDKNSHVQHQEYESGDMLSWASADLPARNMGLPWGFCIMALN